MTEGEFMSDNRSIFIGDGSDACQCDECRRIAAGFFTASASPVPPSLHPVDRAGGRIGIARSQAPRLTVLQGARAC